MFFRNTTKPIPDAPTKDEADLFTLPECEGVCSKRYGQTWRTHVQLIEATEKERASWCGRRGGSAKSPRKASESKRIGRRFGGRRRICKACGKPMERNCPPEKHTHEVCPE